MNIDNPAAEKPHLPEAHLQHLNGKSIGRVVPLTRAITSIGFKDKGKAIIARRAEGYFISALEEHPGLTLNAQPLSDKTLELKNNDVISIDMHKFLFFTPK